jgi:hypothetical protein
MLVHKDWHASTSFAAPMVGASPDNIGAKRLAEGGVPASGAGSVTHQANGEQPKKFSPKQLESDPNYDPN